MPTAERYHQYQLLRREDGSLWELGRGAMGITFKAFDTNLRFPVALKVINSAYLESNTARQRFGAIDIKMESNREDENTALPWKRQL